MDPKHRLPFPTVARFSLTSIRETLGPVLTFVLLAAALLAGAYWLLDPNPPRKVVLATGVSQGAYAEFGKRYAALLAADGITVELRETQGAAENLALLRDANSGVDIAFVQGGADAEKDADTEPDADLVSLGSMFYEPVWLFYREDTAKRRTRSNGLSSLTQLAGWHVNIGGPGSGVPNLMARVIEANGLAADTIVLERKPQTPAVVDLLEGRLDALVFASAPESLMVQMLLQTPGIRLFHFSQADAYARRFAFLSAVTLPRGVVDLAKDSPPADVRLVAPTATLVARRTLHPALVQLFAQAAREVHGRSGWFQRKGDFPNARDDERPLSPEAERYYRNGTPWLQRYLPFWLANLVDRMWLALLSIVAILIPLSRMVPPLVELRIRSRVFRWYGQLRAIESAQGQRQPAELLRELDAIEGKVEHITLPLSYADELYALRSHIALVRGRLQAAA